MAFPVNPAELVEELMRDGIDGLGERLIRRVPPALGRRERPQPAHRARASSASSNEQAAALLRGFVERELLGRIAAAIDAPQPELRASLAGSQMVGLVMARYVVKVEPLAHPIRRRSPPRSAPPSSAT